MSNELKEFDDIKNKIHTIRGKQVMVCCKQTRQELVSWRG